MESREFLCDHPVLKAHFKAMEEAAHEEKEKEQRYSFYAFALFLVGAGIMLLIAYIFRR